MGPLQVGDAQGADAPEPGGLVGAIKKIFGGGDPAMDQTAPPEPADPYADEQKIVDVFEDFHKECFDGRDEFERLWWRNVVYSAFQRHWIYYDRDTRTWRDKRLAKWIPKPVTNITGETAETIVSTFQAVQLGIVARPVGDDPDNAKTAELADRYEPVLQQAHDITARMRMADWWAVHLGGVFLHVWWDPNAERCMRLIPYEQCANCNAAVSPLEIQKNDGICPECNGSSLFNEATDPVTGQPVGEHVSDGEGRTDVCSLLEIGYPLGAENFDEVPGIIRLRWKSKLWYKRYRADLLDTFTWEKMTPERSLQMLRSVSMQSSFGPSPWSGTGAQPMETEGLTEAELWMKPSKDFPEGLVARLANTGGTWKVVPYPEENIPGPLPAEDVKGNKLWPWIFYPYKVVGGRLTPVSPLDAIIQKNDQINQIDSLIQMCLQRTANPVWLEPKGAEVEKFTGEPGLVVKYNPLAGGGNSKPERLEGSSVPAYVMEYRQQLISDVERLAGTFDILKGNKPAGVEAFAAMQLLVERSQSRFGPTLEQRGEAYRKWYALALELERQFGPDERKANVLGDNGVPQSQTFAKSDLQGQITIYVEDGSQIPKTNLGERAAIEHLDQLQLIDKNSPDTQYAVLKSFGQTKLMPQLDVQVRSCRAMQHDFEQWAATAQMMPPDPTAAFEPDPQNPGQPMLDPATATIDPATGQPQPGTGSPMPPQPHWSSPPPASGQMQPWNDATIWSSEIRKWLSGDKMRSLMTANPALVPVCQQLLGQYDMALAQQQMAQAQMQAGGPPAPPEKQGGGRAMQNSNDNAGGVPPTA